MTYQDVVARQHGVLGALFIVEGMPAAFATSDWQFGNTLVSTGFHATRHLPQQYDHFLDSDSVEWAYGIDYRNGDLKMPSCTFVLKDLPVQRWNWELSPDEIPTWTVNGSTFVKRGITDLSSGVARANLARQRANATIGATSVEVDATTGFPSAGPLFWEQETTIYQSVLGAPPRFASMTRGAFHSEAIRHVYDQQDPDRPEDVGWEPFVTNYPISWKGRRVQLWIAEAIPGVGTVARRVWNGKVKANELQDDGVTWQCACESLWDAQRAQICTGLPRTILRGIAMDDVTIYWQAVSQGGLFVPNENGSFDLSGASFGSAQEILDAVVIGLNESLDAGGVVDTRFAGNTGADGRIQIVQVEPQLAGDWRVNFWFTSQVLETFLGVHDVFIPAHSEQPWRGPPAANYVLALNRADASTISVDSTEDFDELDDEGLNYRIQMGCLLGDVPFVIEDVDAPGHTLTVRPLWPLTEDVGLTPDETGQVAVQACLIIRGIFPTVWQRFLESPEIDPRWRIGLRSSDYDWDEIEAYAGGGIGVQRGRIIAKPVPLRDLLLEDLRFAGLVPAISGTDAKLSARILGPPADGLSLGELNEYSHEIEKLPRLRTAEDLLVTGLRVEAKKLAWGNGAEVTFALTVDYPANAALYGGGEVVTLKTDALINSLGPIDPAVISAHVALLANRLVQLFGKPAWLGSCPCTIRPAMQLPGDSAHLTHATWIDPDTGERGVTNSLCLITNVQYAPFKAKTQVDVWLPADPGRRSGWAPSAVIVAATDDGAGEGARQYRLTVDPGDFGGDEASFFTAGMLVTLIEEDSATPASEPLEISSAEHSADGLSIYVTSMPMNDPSGGEWVLELQDYDTALQTEDAQSFVHVCDEDDFEIGTSGDQGFKPV